MEKKYKLLKDTPKCLAGDIFTSNDGDYYRNERNGQLYEGWVVESKPDWFQEIVEPVFPKGILEIMKNGNFCNGLHNYTYNEWLKWGFDNGYTITRVQNSSGEVFSVGDEVVADGINHGNKIISFEIGGSKEVLFANLTGTTRVWHIDLLTKSTPKTFTKAEIEAALNNPFIGRIGRTEFKRTLGI